MDIVITDNLNNWGDSTRILIFPLEVRVGDSLGYLSDEDSVNVTFSTPTVQDNVTQLVVERATALTDPSVLRTSQIIVEEAHEPDHEFDIYASQVVVEEAHEPDHQIDIYAAQLIVEVAYKQYPNYWICYEVRKV